MYINLSCTYEYKEEGLLVRPLLSAGSPRCSPNQSWTGCYATIPIALRRMPCSLLLLLDAMHSILCYTSRHAGVREQDTVPLTTCWFLGSALRCRLNGPAAFRGATVLAHCLAKSSLTYEQRKEKTLARSVSGAQGSMCCGGARVEGMRRRLRRTLAGAAISGELNESVRVARPSSSSSCRCLESSIFLSVITQNDPAGPPSPIDRSPTFLRPRPAFSPTLYSLHHLRFLVRGPIR